MFIWKVAIGDSAGVGSARLFLLAQVTPNGVKIAPDRDM
jgi:hypothetical protein